MTRILGSHLNRVKDLSGTVFGRLTAIGTFGRDKWNRSTWLCQCECGKEAIVPSQRLVQMTRRSCGCLSVESSRLNGKAGGHKNRGSNCHLYDPNLTDEQRQKFRSQSELRAWRNQVFEKFDYTCDVCGARGGDLRAHHLNNWAKHPEERFSTKNGVCLCHKHHWEFHTSWMGGPRNPCTAINYWEYKENRNGSLSTNNEVREHIRP